MYIYIYIYIYLYTHAILQEILFFGVYIGVPIFMATAI